MNSNNILSFVRTQTWCVISPTVVNQCEVSGDRDFATTQPFSRARLNNASGLLMVLLYMWEQLPCCVMSLLFSYESNWMRGHAFMFHIQTRAGTGMVPANVVMSFPKLLIKPHCVFTLSWYMNQQLLHNVTKYLRNPTTWVVTLVLSITL